MTKQPVRNKILAVGLAAGVLAAACGSDDATSSDPTTDEATADAPSTYSSDEVTDSAVDPSEGDEAASTATESDDSPSASIDFDALGVTDEAATAMAQLYDDALASGDTEVTIYGPLAATLAPALEKISESFPEITVTAEALSGPELETRLATEFSTDQHNGDMLLTPTFNYVDLGYHAEYQPAGASVVEVGQYPEDNMYAFLSEPFGILYNTDNMTPDEAPKSWVELTDPRFQGRIATGSLVAPGATTATLARLFHAELIDEDWLRALAENEPSQRSNLELAEQAVIRGEYDMLPAEPGAFAEKVVASGAPVEFIFPLPEGGNLIGFNFLNVVEGAGDPDAAALVLEYVFSEEFQSSATELGALPLVPGIPNSSGLSIDDIELAELASPRELTDLFGPIGEMGIEIFGDAAG